MWLGFRRIGAAVGQQEEGQVGRAVFGLIVTRLEKFKQGKEENICSRFGSIHLQLPQPHLWPRD